MGRPPGLCDLYRLAPLPNPLPEGFPGLRGTPPAVPSHDPPDPGWDLGGRPMRTLIIALAALTLPAAGCRLFRGDCPSRHYRYDPPPVVVPAGPIPTAVAPY